MFNVRVESNEYTNQITQSVMITQPTSPESIELWQKSLIYQLTTFLSSFFVVTDWTQIEY